MTTRIIGVKEFRQNISKLPKGSRKNKVCYIVMNHSVPLWKVLPVEDEDDLIDQLIYEKYGAEIEKAREEVRRGKYFTTAEVKKRLRLS